MSSAKLRTLLVVGIGSGLGYLVAMVGVDVPRPVHASSKPTVQAPQESPTPEGQATCSEGINRNALLAMAEPRAEANAAQDAKAAKKPNIILLVSDDTGWGDLGPYGGGNGRGMATPNFDRMAREGMKFWSFYGQPSCTPGRAALITGRIPNRTA